MRICLVFMLLVIFSCQDNSNKQPAEKGTGGNDTSVVAGNSESEKNIFKTEPLALVADTGQTWYKVRVTKNDSSFIDFEGTWPVYLSSKGFATLGFTAKRGALVISHGLTFYVYGLSSGKMPILHYANEKGEVGIILVPEHNGAYGIAITPDTGYVNFTKNDGKVLSGHFEARTLDKKKDIYKFQGQFLNVKPS